MEKTLCLLRAVKGQWGRRDSACRRPGAGKVKAAGWPGKGGQDRSSEKELPLCQEGTILHFGEKPREAVRKGVIWSHLRFKDDCSALWRIA